MTAREKAKAILLVEALRAGRTRICDEAAETIESLERQLKRTADELEYIYRCVDDGFRSGIFDLGVARERARDFIERGCQP